MLAGSQGDIGAPFKLRQAGYIIGEYRLLKELNVILPDVVGKLNCGSSSPNIVSVQHKTDIGADGLTHRGHPAHILHGVLAALHTNLQLDLGIAPSNHHLSLFYQLFDGIAGPPAGGVDRDHGVSAAQQAVQRHIQQLALDIPQSNVHRAVCTEGQAFTAHTAHVVEGLLVERLGLKGTAANKFRLNGIANKLTNGFAAHLMVSNSNTSDTRISVHLNHNKADSLNLAG